ncbi:MAG: GrpB family protein [Sporomusaceae bacterium]|nr:GrpB family protein [Sporomusaceae bacterium]
MSIGLKRGLVELADNDPEWELLAHETIGRLWHVFGAVAQDIQHVGSTAIHGIKAKPIIDIAVAVNDFDEVCKLMPALAGEGFIHRAGNDGDCQVFFVCGDFVKDTRTHHIHVVRNGGVEWGNYLLFRDYLNENPNKAKAYEAVKLDLMSKYQNDRLPYTAGKSEFIRNVIAVIHRAGNVEDKLIVGPKATAFKADDSAEAVQQYYHSHAQVWRGEFGLTEIPAYSTFTKIEPLNKGWSSDKKFCIETAEGRRLLLRVAGITEYERKHAEYSMVQQVAALGVPTSQPIAFGVCDCGRKVYQLLTWCDGEDAETALPMLTETEQYVLGLKAGEILRRIHALPAPETQESWASRFNCKTSIKIQKYRECCLRFEGDEKVIAYIEKNRGLLANRPQCCQHGDYHVGNMIVSGKNTLSIIDWNRPDYGDPWEEFNRIVWSATASPFFATGQLRGYFGGEPPLDFFKLLAFYIASNTLSSVYWAIPFGQGEIDTMLKQTQDVLRWFDNMQSPVPVWYLQNFCIRE